MIKGLKSIGQLKRKGKFDLNSEFMKKKPSKAVDNAISDPIGRPDANSLLGNPNSKSILDDLGVGSTGNVGSYVPTEFPLEAKLVQPAYTLEPASPSSNDLE